MKSWRLRIGGPKILNDVFAFKRKLDKWGLSIHFNLSMMVVVDGNSVCLSGTS